MAVLIGLVGSIAPEWCALTQTLERRHEIGVMLIGASSFAIFRLFVGEGLILGWLSWLISLPLAWPAGKLMMQAMSAAFGLDMVHHATFTGPLLWLGIITILSIVASWLPALGATRISVRESLVYQ
jgi:ABC-type antimicrobial peptide transport system permease subunit